ncbi:hypothetical protein FB566_0898 [Stackebrandtia endophytica]|uniref:Uncharacterized protein n=1 Tax=Stackebrandtia endophytica TaxID=1496996 RepID=A0A543AS67_9ACTN|nr:hypothetical protein [Stackebrandtia endophytica]TQL75396.1 hypothetical protein FB566_0898 [Stackebrandtia endophytica]
MYEAETEDLAAYRRAQDEGLTDEPGWPADPGQGWRRLRWHELAERTGNPVVVQHVAPQYRVPSFRAFFSVKQGDGLWETISWPDWGTLDRESFHSLAAVLQRFSGSDTVTFAHPCPLRDPEVEPHVFRGRLGDLALLEQLDAYHTPANMWPADRSWLVYTDWDLSGTKIYGPPELLTMIEEDKFLETVWLPLPGDTS